MEIWKTVQEAPDYEVSNLGNVRVGNTGEILKQHKDSYGYMKVRLYANGEGENKLVHRLVASAFIANPENKSMVNHKDGNKSNNDVDNLEWATATENIHHSYNVLGQTHTGEKRDKSSCGIRLSLKLFRVSRNLTQKEFAQTIGAGRAMYSLIEKGDRFGSFDFWLNLQKAFDIPDEEMFKLMKVER